MKSNFANGYKKLVGAWRMESAPEDCQSQRPINLLAWMTLWISVSHLASLIARWILRISFARQQSFAPGTKMLTPSTILQLKKCQGSSKQLNQSTSRLNNQCWQFETMFSKRTTRLSHSIEKHPVASRHMSWSLKYSMRRSKLYLFFKGRGTDHAPSQFGHKTGPLQWNTASSLKNHRRKFEMPNIDWTSCRNRSLASKNQIWSGWRTQP